MSFDLSALGTLNEADLTKEDWNQYENTATPKPTTGGGDFKKTLPEGIYTLRVPATLTQENLAKTKDDYLQLVFEPEVATGPFAGQTLGRKEYVSIKKLPNSKASFAGNLLRAAKLGLKPTNNAEWVKAFQQLAGKSFPAHVRWEGKDKVTNTYVRGAENWPMLPNGQRGRYIERINPANGETYRVYADPRVDWFKTGGQA